MKSSVSFLLTFTFIISSCHISSHSAKEDGDRKNKLYPLVHIVYFKTKKDADLSALISEIRKIKAISVLKDLEVGTFKDLGDKRAMSEYNLVIQMRFANEAEYQVYQKHPIHLTLKKNAGPYLAGPPVTYDYVRSKD